MTFYDTIAPSYEALHREEQLRKLRIIREHLALPREARILDVGSGPCWSAELFDCVTGVDPSLGLLRLARNSTRNRSMPELLQARAEALPFRNHTFDAVLCVTAIHHFELDKALREMKRVARPGAPVVITVLKKAKGKESIVQKLRERFVIAKDIEEEKDVLFFLTPAAP